MTVNEAVDALQNRLDESTTAPRRYTDAIVLTALTSAQEEIAARAVPGLLRPLQYSAQHTVAAAGIALTTINTKYFRYIASRQYAIGDGKLIKKLDVEDLYAIDNTYLSYSNSDPVCYIWGTKYYLLVASYASSYNAVEFFVLTTPDALVAGASFQVNAVLVPPLLLLAEATLRSTYKHGTPEEIDAKRIQAYGDISNTNKEYKQGVLTT